MLVGDGVWNCSEVGGALEVVEATGGTQEVIGKPEVASKVSERPK